LSASCLHASCLFSTTPATPAQTPTQSSAVNVLRIESIVTRISVGLPTRV
jgi:hypothetical protein